MSKYYYLIAGLPNIALDDTKLTYTVSDFRDEIYPMLTPEDKKIIDLFFFKFDNKNLIEQVKSPDREPDPRGQITYDEFTEFVHVIKEGGRLATDTNIPVYLVDFYKAYLAEENSEAQVGIAWEDRLASLYYGYAMKSKNKFVADWFELNLNINNILTAMTARKYELDKVNYIIGNNEIAETLRISNARDFSLGNTVDYLPEIQRIAEEPDLLAREKRLDQLKWDWLEANTFFKPFDIESVFAYLLKLEMIERWLMLDSSTGEDTFRGLIGTMKKGSDHALEEFKRNNKK